MQIGSMRCSMLVACDACMMMRHASHASFLLGMCMRPATQEWTTDDLGRDQKRPDTMSNPLRPPSDILSILSDTHPSDQSDQHSPDLSKRSTTHPASLCRSHPDCRQPVAFCRSLSLSTSSVSSDYLIVESLSRPDLNSNHIVSDDHSNEMGVSLANMR